MTKKIKLISCALAVHYYTDSACTEGDTVGVIGQCEQASAPFVATNVICPNYNALLLYFFVVVLGMGNVRGRR